MTWPERHGLPAKKRAGRAFAQHADHLNDGRSFAP
uniref:Uncharacterized protein n=1 Tax=Caudovirales sp. ct0jG3 TaxID=2825756 RepID=A0A8S5NU09_9CAUD|nr:MAG TPA: hypothetical protein [Caudovirales sp. ct0jG3]